MMHDWCVDPSTRASIAQAALVAAMPTEVFAHTRTGMRVDAPRRSFMIASGSPVVPTKIAALHAMASASDETTPSGEVKSMTTSHDGGVDSSDAIETTDAEPSTDAEKELFDAHCAVMRSDPSCCASDTMRVPMRPEAPQIVARGLDK